MLTITVQAIRTDCITNVSKDVDVTIAQKYHSGLSSWWIEITCGAVTGYESMQIDHLKNCINSGWHGCAGTDKRWDTLFLPPESMLKIYNWTNEEQTQLEREQASALTKEPLDPCSSRLQKERIKNDIDQNNC